MSLEQEATHQISLLAIEASADVVDAGAEFTLVGRAQCTPACDLRGLVLEITDQDGRLVGSAEFTQFDGETNQTDELVVTAPTRPGDFAWSAVLPAYEEEEEELSLPEATASVTVKVRAHATSVVVWDVPSAIVGGETFKIKIGVKCSSACPPAQRRFAIWDNEGNQLAEGAPGDDVWPGTDALHFAEVELKAPQTLGTHQWQAKVLASDAEPAHAEGTATFGITAVKAPEFEVVVEAVDGDGLSPLKGAQVLLHPYRAVTDETGMARVMVPRGAYTIFVSAPKHVTVRTDVEVTENIMTRAALSQEPPRERF